MAFCADCDEGVRFDKETDWHDSPGDSVGTVYHYTCINSDCANDGGKVFARADGGVAREEGVW